VVRLVRAEGWPVRARAAVGWGQGRRLPLHLGDTGQCPRGRDPQACSRDVG
jgi:hypothetical protein